MYGLGGVTFFSTAQHIGRCTQTWHYGVESCLFLTIVIKCIAFSGRAETPLGQTSPCLWTGTYFFNFSQSCNLRAFTGTQPSFTGQQKQCPQRLSECRAPCGCMQVAVSRRYGAFLPSYQAHAVAPAPNVLPQSKPFCAPKAFVVHQGKQQPVE